MAIICNIIIMRSMSVDWEVLQSKPLVASLASKPCMSSCGTMSLKKLMSSSSSDGTNLQMGDENLIWVASWHFRTTYQDKWPMNLAWPQWCMRNNLLKWTRSFGQFADSDSEFQALHRNSMVWLKVLFGTRHPDNNKPDTSVIYWLPHADNWIGVCGLMDWRVRRSLWGVENRVRVPKCNSQDNCYWDKFRLGLSKKAILSTLNPLEHLWTHLGTLHVKTRWPNNLQ